MPINIHAFLTLPLVMYLNPKKKSPSIPKNKPKTVNSLNRKYPLGFKQKSRIPKATKNNEAMVLKMIVLSE